MYGKTKSIILQVAFKEAAAGLDGSREISDIKLLTSQYYVLLQELHAEIGIDPDDEAPKPWANKSSGGGGFTPKPKMETPASAVAFTTADGTVWLDYRAAKAKSEVVKGFPEFKTVDQTKGVGQSIWEYSQDGTPVPEAIELINAANAIATLTAPM